MRELVVDRHRHRRRADHPGRDLDVLLSDGVDDVGRGETAGRDLARIEPDPHGIVAAAEDLRPGPCPGSGARTSLTWSRA